MLTNVDVGWIVLFNDHSGSVCPALVTKVYTPGDPNSDLDLHVIGVKNNASYARGKIQVTYGIATTGSWEYTSTRNVFIESSDLPNDGEAIFYNAISDSFETESITFAIDCIDAGTF